MNPQDETAAQPVAPGSDPQQDDSQLQEGGT